MLNFTFVQTVKILNGKGCIKKIGELLEQAGYHKAFLVIDSILYSHLLQLSIKSGIIEKGDKNAN